MKWELTARSIRYIEITAHVFVSGRSVGSSLRSRNGCRRIVLPRQKRVRIGWLSQTTNHFLPTRVTVQIVVCRAVHRFGEQQTVAWRGVAGRNRHSDYDLQRTQWSQRGVCFMSCVFHAPVCTWSERWTLVQVGGNYLVEDWETELELRGG